MAGDKAPGSGERITEALSENALYFILDESICVGRDPLEISSLVMEAGVRMIQVRFKQLSSDSLLELLRNLRSLCTTSGSLLIVNDRPELAVACKADGVHVGPDDPSPELIRREYPGLIIGASARDPQAAVQLQGDGADYIGCGAMFPSTTKNNAPVVGITGLAQLTHLLKIPVIGIGGITPGNFRSVLNAGAAGVCSIAPFAGCDSPGQLAGLFMLRTDNS